MDKDHSVRTETLTRDEIQALRSMILRSLPIPGIGTWDRPNVAPAVTFLCDMALRAESAERELAAVRQQTLDQCEQASLYQRLTRHPAYYIRTSDPWGRPIIDCAMVNLSEKLRALSPPPIAQAGDAQDKQED